MITLNDILDQYPRNLSLWQQVYYWINQYLKYFGYRKNMNKMGNFKYDINGIVSIQHKCQYCCYFTYNVDNDMILIPGVIYHFNQFINHIHSYNYLDINYLHQLTYISIYKNGWDLSMIPIDKKINISVHEDVDCQSIKWPEYVHKLCIYNYNSVISVDLTDVNINKLIVQMATEVSQIVYTNIGTIIMGSISSKKPETFPLLIGPPIDIRIGKYIISWDNYPNKTEVIPGMTKSATKM